MTTPDPRGIYFDSRYFDQRPQTEYVCWLDVMGSGNQMQRSLPISANFIYKLHCAILEAADDLPSKDGIDLYPVMDGAYITSARRGPLQSIINQTMRRVVYTFVNELKPYHQFLVRGAVAYGPVFHGHQLDTRTTRVLATHERIRDSILLGLPIAEAYKAESDAPPFGIAAHSSARAFAPEGDRPFRFIWLDWYRSATPPVDTEELLSKLGAYFEWQDKHYNMTGYKPEAITRHRRLAEEYFTASSYDDDSQQPQPPVEEQPSTTTT